MREYAKKPENQSRTLDSNPKASRQASIDVILQRYEERNIQKYAEDEELIQGKFETAQCEEVDEDELLQGRFESTLATEQKSAQRKEKLNNTGLPDNLKTGIENLSGYSMDDVHVHYSSDKPAQLNALAYAQGTDIHIASGQEKHLPHEAWHIVQQKQGRVKSTIQQQGVNVNNDERLENEADEMGYKSLEKSVYNRNFEPSNKNLYSCSSVSQLRVLAIGDIDDEVDIAQGNLCLTTGLSPDIFENVKDLKNTEDEILIGHGTNSSLGGGDENTLFEQIKSKINTEHEYNLKFVACNTGKDGDSDNDSIAKTIFKKLQNDNYKVNITAPKDLVYVLAPGQIKLGNPFSKEVIKLAQEVALKEEFYSNVIKEIIDDFIEEIKSKVSEDDFEIIEKDIAILKSKNNKKAKGNKKQSDPYKEFYISIVEEIRKSEPKNTDSLYKIVQYILNLYVYKKVMTDYIPYGELERILEKKYLIKFLYPIANLAHTSKKSYSQIPSADDEGWSSYRIEGL